MNAALKEFGPNCPSSTWNRAKSSLSLRARGSGPRLAVIVPGNLELCAHTESAGPTLVAAVAKAKAAHEERLAQVQGAQDLCEDQDPPPPPTSLTRWSGLSVSNECARISVNTLTASMGNMSVQQGPRGVDRGRHQSFFALNAPQGNPFAAAGAASVPFPPRIQQQPFTGQIFMDNTFALGIPSASSDLIHDGKAAKIKFKVRKFFAKIKVRRLLEKDAKAADMTCSPRALVALESQLVRLCEICTVCLGLNGVQVNAYSVELAHSFELRLQRNQDFDG
ncbi:meiosis mei2 [Fusarium tjaetaba]|uniref:Meiosis mei2 n=1 Tax=Fusarium tjaetaba TaxID=1567544 RepID=A0A8H5S9L0_9HYPO|nr:meiosis mei2 [Fusarium tjaetaba]KAF5646657.1 meiosis mei2 [Fusarium tjaetaba]